MLLAQPLAELDQEHRGLLGGHVQHRRARGKGSQVHCCHLCLGFRLGFSLRFSLRFRSRQGLD